MNYTGQNRLRLLGRNEGKIKSYESCNDVRAWSHDIGVRDHYLREWIKCDMPICVLPVCTLANFLRTMTCRSRAKATPRCHPDCKSKVVLESICASCQSIRDCLKNDENYNKYFVEEEFDTCHWPCERCLEALKSIKMLWKIIIEKLFNVNFSTHDVLSSGHCSRTESVRSIARVWQNDIVQQTMLVRNITPLMHNKSKETTSSTYSSRLNKNSKKATPTRIPKPCKIEDKGDGVLRFKASKSPTCSIKSFQSKATEIVCPCSSDRKRSYDKLPRRKHSRCTLVRVKTVDIGCDTCKFEKVEEDIKAYKTNLAYLQEQFNTQKDEIDILKTENMSLKIELQNVYKNHGCKSSLYSHNLYTHKKEPESIIPKPFEPCIEETADMKAIQDIDSEMIITMKNCKNESFRHVSLLQVLHKTNEPIMADLNISTPCNKREDPINLLTKVQNTFGAIVRREMTIANEKRHRTRKSDIDATVYRVNTSRSAPSCSTISSNLESSESNFMTTKDTSEKNDKSD